MRRRALALLWLVARSRGGGDGGGFLDFELSNGFELPVVGLGVGNLAHRSIPAVVSAGVERFGVRLVWYTHLGYGRTRLAVEESLKSLGGGVDVVMLLHWPRCRDDIAWMRCAEEEAEAELRYRGAGPAPGADAWVGSWRALEEFYGAGRLAAIGVSNFDYDDMARLLRDGVAPCQGNVWAFLFDPRLVELLREHRVRFVAYNVMNGVVARRAAAPGAAAKLDALAAASGVDAATLVLKARAARRRDGAPRVGAVRVFWENESTGERVPVTADIAPGTAERLSTHPGHKFVAYRGAELLKTFTVTAPRGGWQEFEL
ncbi:oxidoreductase [Aureococcus anophagefferens]|nr:oxidoreductase [Aureococcus anophagefferens]